MEKMAKILSEAFPTKALLPTSSLQSCPPPRPTFSSSDDEIRQVRRSDTISSRSTLPDLTLRSVRAIELSGLCTEATAAIHLPFYSWKGKLAYARRRSPGDYDSGENCRKTPFQGETDERREVGLHFQGSMGISLSHGMWLTNAGI